ncbi:hypothetical protein Taro_009044 [Colocasia esculenta]|uniref:AAA+ ATPase domain-containing protein n=1 Tax=Colocasia esculenta TaxID=4460 RepID=A0A843TZ15_COLES|nr:hypothetical protein [Colocasia esculenta]
MASPKALLSTAASLAASAMLVRTIVNDFLPHQIHDYIFSGIAAVLGRFSSELVIAIEEFNGFAVNELYRAAEVYLGTKIPPSTRRLKVSKQENEKSLEVTVERGEVVVDVFQGVKFTWRLVCYEKHHEVFRGPRSMNGGMFMGPTLESESRSFELSFHKKHKSKALDAYLHHVLEESKTKQEEDKSLKLHTAKYDHLYGNMMDVWTPVNLDHPATFETIAMDPDLKRAVMEDLQRFVRRKDYYRKVGKAWKRGYLLYGPPGTGKSSLIAAMANYLKFDVYDLELTEIRCNSNLRTLLVATANRSILVVEDIDCTIELEDRKKEAMMAVEMGRQGGGRMYREERVTLSGLLNFMDGLWSSCGDERIIVFTTNHKERLDPALLRPGRMDLHIHMGYCSPQGFRALADNYHGVCGHPRFEEIDGLLGEVEVTPAEVAEELMKSDDVEEALGGLVKFIERKKMEAEAEAKEKAEEPIGRNQQEEIAGHVGDNAETAKGEIDQGIEEKRE